MHFYELRFVWVWAWVWVCVVYPFINASNGQLIYATTSWRCWQPVASLDPLATPALAGAS